MSNRIFTVFKVKIDYETHQIDIYESYLNANLEEEVYMRALKRHPDIKNRYWKLNIVIYGFYSNAEAEYYSLSENKDYI